MIYTTRHDVIFTGQMSTGGRVNRGESEDILQGPTRNVVLGRAALGPGIPSSFTPRLGSGRAKHSGGSPSSGSPHLKNLEQALKLFFHTSWKKYLPQAAGVS
jgi:hypothetical protein